jgi:hypothetical protein
VPQKVIAIVTRTLKIGYKGKTIGPPELDMLCKRQESSAMGFLCIRENMWLGRTIVDIFDKPRSICCNRIYMFFKKKGCAVITVTIPSLSVMSQPLSHVIPLVSVYALWYDFCRGLYFSLSSMFMALYLESIHRDDARRANERRFNKG